jgi:deaminated glutathione amidase
VRVAVGQFFCGFDKEANLARAVDAARRAAEQGAALLVLPEATMAGFGDGSTDLLALAEELDGPFATGLAKAAATYDVTVVAGMFEVSAAPGRVHNTVVAVGPGGPLGHYRKYHLFDALGWRESDRVAAGDPGIDEPLVFAVGGLSVGVMNCYDLRFPEMARVLVDRGATVLATPANWIAGPGKAETWATLLRARAIESTAYVVAAAKPGPECAGHSMVVDPAGVVLAELGADEDALAVADLAPERVAAVRQAVPVLANRRFVVRAR